MVMHDMIRCLVCAMMLLILTSFSLKSAAANPQEPEQNQPTHAAATLPARVDLRSEFKKLGFEPRRQGHRGTCSVFTVTAALEFAIAKKTDKPAPLSVEYLNWAANQVIHYNNTNGQFFHNLIKGYQDYGICREDLMPYRMDNDPTYEPSSEARENAASLKQVALKITWIKPLGQKRGLTDEQMTQIKQTLVNGWPVGAGSGHSRLFVGYRDDPNQPGGGRFITKDSAVGGYARVTYEWAKSKVCDVFWIEPEAKEEKTSLPQGETELKPAGIEKTIAK